MANENPQFFLKCVGRLTGHPGRPANHSFKLFRIEVTSSDGITCGVPISAPLKKVYPNTRKQIANSLRLKIEDVDAALADWEPENTRKHLGQFSAEVLNSPAGLQKFLEPPSA